MFMASWGVVSKLKKFKIPLFKNAVYKKRAKKITPYQLEG